MVVRVNAQAQKAEYIWSDGNEGTAEKVHAIYSAALPAFQYVSFSEDKDNGPSMPIRVTLALCCLSSWLAVSLTGSGLIC